MKFYSPPYFQLRQLISKGINITELNGNWNRRMGILKQKLAFLTENDVMFVEGKEEEMFGKLQIKLGKRMKNCSVSLKESSL